MLYGSGVNIIPTQRQNNHVQVVYNIYTGGDTIYPKSKKLNIKMSKINISKNEGIFMGDEEITLTGNWEFGLEVPEKMYNRKEINYIQKSSTNEEYKVVSATLYDTGFEITMNIKTDKPPVYPMSLEDKYYRLLDDTDELKSFDILKYISFEEEQKEEYRKFSEKRAELYYIESYVENEKGEIFKMSQGPSENGSIYIDENGNMKYNVTFDLTKYDKTNKLTIHTTYRGANEKIVLELKEDK